MAIVRRDDTPPTVRRAREWDPFQAMRELMRWDPFQDLMPRLLRGSDERLTFAPAFDVRESKDTFLFTADLPGFKDEDIDINVTGNRLTISGKREAEHVEDSDTFFCSERSHGSFTRTFTLPEGVDADRIEADLENGILTLRVPKTAEAQPKRIQVRGQSGVEGKGQRRGEKAQGRSEPKD
jgi:HSP20 family protein